MKTTIETYQQQKARHSAELDNFEGIFFAFNNSQLGEGLAKVNAQKNEIISIGMGGFLRKDKVNDFTSLMNRHSQERKELRKNRKELINAIAYELANHEYCITRNPQDALDCFDLTMETVDMDMLKKAIKQHNKNHIC